MTSSSSIRFPSPTFLTIKELFKQLRKHNVKLSPSKEKTGATDAGFLGHTISPAGIRPNANKVADLMRMLMPLDPQATTVPPRWFILLRETLGRYGHKEFGPSPLSCLTQGAKFVFTPAMEAIVRTLLEELSAPPFLVYPDWDSVADNSRPFLLYCDATIDGFGATLEQEEKGGSIRPLVFISCATLESERHWTPLDLEAGGIVWSIKRLRGYFWGTTFRIISDHEALESFAKGAEHNLRVPSWLEFLTADRYTQEYDFDTIPEKLDRTLFGE